VNVPRAVATLRDRRVSTRIKNWTAEIHPALDGLLSNMTT
jgi:hypothetical protein